MRQPPPLATGGAAAGVAGLAGFAVATGTGAGFATGRTGREAGGGAAFDLAIAIASALLRGSGRGKALRRRAAHISVAEDRVLLDAVAVEQGRAVDQQRPRLAFLGGL